MKCVYAYTPFFVRRESQLTPNTPQFGWYFHDREGVVWGPYFSHKRANERAAVEKMLSQLVTPVEEANPA